MSHGVVCKYHYRENFRVWLTSVTVWLFFREGVAKCPCKCGSVSEIYTYTPTQKSKIERWFRTLRDKWLGITDLNQFSNLDEIRGSLYEFVQRYNQSVHSSLDGKSPEQRFFSEPEYIRRLSAEKTEQSFLLEAERRVSADCVLVIDRVEYEVDSRFAGRKVRLRYAPDMKTVYVVEADGALTGIRVLNKQENAVTKRRKIYLSEGGQN